jgi:GTP cyclohydrolase II
VSADPEVPLLVWIHSECFTGDVLGSERSDCGPQLLEAVRRIAQVGGLLVYLRQEGRGIGLYAKLDACTVIDRYRRQPNQLPQPRSLCQPPRSPPQPPP